jgi:hypothetical protein
MQILADDGVTQPSRNGDVVRLTEPVSTVYTRPCERVEFHPWRDSNPFLHFYESLWMLAGRRDVAPLARYAKQMEQYSDDGETLNAAYGYRWRHASPVSSQGRHDGTDQLPVICDALRADPISRQQVLQIWDHREDLGTQTRDHACNLTATFQVQNGRLDMVVFCRSNDAIWGCYGANAVHFSMLQEYVARRAGFDVGTYTQISVNWHAYTDVYDKMQGKRLRCDDIVRIIRSSTGAKVIDSVSPYDSLLMSVAPYPIAADSTDFARWDALCKAFVSADGQLPQMCRRQDFIYPFFRDVAWPIVAAHDLYKDGVYTSPRGDKKTPWDDIYATLDECQASDWRLACRMWMMRRQARHVLKTDANG